LIEASLNGERTAIDWIDKIGTLQARIARVPAEKCASINKTAI
jgi:hypothetical protein